MALTVRHVGEAQRRLGRTRDRELELQRQRRTPCSPPAYRGVPCLSPKPKHRARARDWCELEERFFH
ncbi:hypothetical protein CgunFtcFv8_005502 [Champsocephalus gunnari]|uniref:Uncharacterized protein n=1 Tax=Champsocephalus gunnari TaxID=52237 RepID=A0AAN8CVR1_CHAGU|nr:hypothetical protein CgunFtcFv8_005502 [Champsocephalus gunnari]